MMLYVTLKEYLNNKDNLYEAIILYDDSAIIFFYVFFCAAKAAIDRREEVGMWQYIKH